MSVVLAVYILATNVSLFRAKMRDYDIFFLFFILFKHSCNCLPQKHLGLSRGLTIIQ